MARTSLLNIARAYDVPPWIVYPDYPRPRLARLRWALRKVWPGLVWDWDAQR